MIIDHLTVAAKGGNLLSASMIERLAQLGGRQIDRESGLEHSVWLAEDRTAAIIIWSRFPIDLDAAFGTAGGYFFQGYVREGSRCWQADEILAFNTAHREIDPSALGGVFALV